MAIPGAQNGFTNLRYLGTAIQRQYWMSKSRFNYTFSAKRPVFAVDTGDVEEFLSHKMADGKSPMFEVVEPKDDEGGKGLPEPTEPTDDGDGDGEESAPNYRKRDSKLERAAVRGAHPMIELYALDYEKIEGTGKDGKITKADIEAHLETWDEKIEERATEGAIEAARKNGVDIRIFFNRVPTTRRISKTDVETFVMEQKAAIEGYAAEFEDAEDDE